MGLPCVVDLPYRAEMCHIVSVRRSQRVGGHLLCHLLVCTQILSLQQGIFKSTSETRPWWIPVVSVLMERSPEIQESSSRCSPSSATATWSSPEFFHADIYISEPTLLFRETQWHGVRVILFVHYSDTTNGASVLLCHRLDSQQTGSK